MKPRYFYLVATTKAVLLLTGYFVVANTAYANGIPPTRPNPCPTLSVGCCPPGTDLDLAKSSASCKAKSNGEEHKLEAASAFASKTMDTYSAIAKQAELFYEKAFNQIVQILNWTGLLLVGIGVVITAIIGFFLTSEHKSIEALRVHYRERLDLVVREAAIKAEERYEEKQRETLDDIQANKTAIEEVKGFTFAEAQAMSSFLVGIGQMTIGEIRGIQGEKELSKRHLQMAERALAIAENFWEKPEMRKKGDAVNTLAYLWGNLAYAKKRLGDNQSALDLIEKAINYAPNNPAYLFNAGCYAALCSFRAKSLEYFTRTINADPKYKEELLQELSEKGDASTYGDDDAFKALLKTE